MAKPVLVVVDDEDASLQALTGELESRYGAHYDVVSASSPEAAMARLAEKRIPDSFSYGGIAQLRAEAREKLSRVRPRNLSQASRISGITPADVALLIVHLDGRGKIATSR